MFKLKPGGTGFFTKDSNKINIGQIFWQKLISRKISYCLQVMYLIILLNYNYVFSVSSWRLSTKIWPWYWPLPQTNNYLRPQQCNDLHPCAMSSFIINNFCCFLTLTLNFKLIHLIFKELLFFKCNFILIYLYLHDEKISSQFTMWQFTSINVPWWNKIYLTIKWNFKCILLW